MNPAKTALLLAIVALGAAVIGWGSPGSKPDQANECTTNTCYVNPSFWKLSTTFALGSGICTTSASYVQGDGGNSVSVTTPSSPPVNINAVFSIYTFYDFDVHVTLAGTQGKISIYDSIFGVGIPLSREMVVAELGIGGGSGALQLGQNLGLGPGTSDTFDLQIQRTAGTGSVCIDGLEGTAYVLAIGGSPA